MFSNKSGSVDSRQPIHQTKVGAVVVGIFRKTDYDDETKIFYDYRISREFPSGDQMRLGPFVQRRDLLNVVRALLEADKWLEDRRYYHNKSANSYRSSDRNRDEGYGSIDEDYEPTDEDSFNTNDV